MLNQITSFGYAGANQGFLERGFICIMVCLEGGGVAVLILSRFS